MQPCKDFYSESPFFPLRYMTINVQVTNMPGLIVLNVCAFCFFFAVDAWNRLRRYVAQMLSTP